MGGLGNQFFQYAAARQLSLIYDVPLKLDVQKYIGNQKRQCQLHHYHVEVELATPDELAQVNRKRDDRGWRRPLRRFGITPTGSIRYCREVKDRINQLPDPIRNSVYLRGYWQFEHYFKDIAPRIREELRLREALGPAAESLALEMESVPSVAVHVRRGDYASDPKVLQRLGLCPLEYYEKAATILRNAFDDLRFYVFSDDPDWVRTHLKMLDPVVFVEFDSSRRDLVDLEVMSRCRHFIIANSTYSWWAAWLGRHPDKQVVAPRRWFVDERRNTLDRYPEGWEAIDWD
ncbi:MAG: alpha-1,2-fucosyltransferase [Planctomycetota bacterium]|nr:alpha-1,2-fucosyltransferase [Planctomycetota bacterium]